MTRLPSIEVEKNLDNRLPYIMTRLPSIGVKKSRQQTNFHNDKAIIHWSKNNLDNRLPSKLTRLPSIGVTKISTTDYLH